MKKKKELKNKTEKNHFAYNVCLQMFHKIEVSIDNFVNILFELKKVFLVSFTKKIHL